MKLSFTSKFNKFNSIKNVSKFKNFCSVRFYQTEQSKQPLKTFDKILIANRGEIACRIIRTCKKLGIKTVAVYSDPDKYALHTRSADEAVYIGPAPTSQSYLRKENILAAIKKTGAQALHPGYGFMSENTEFAHLLEDNGVVFIGPGSSAIKVMGDKIESKRLAKSAGVHTIPGFIGEVHTDEEVLKIANEIGYPIMVKAAGGGGGKGMRVAWNDKQALEGFRLSKQEALSSFGNDRMLIEKFIDQPRHIEVQVLSDGKDYIYLNERECSIQRRNQKVIEEAPSSFLDPKTRQAMGEQACALAKAVGYKSAGTVEFLVDPQRNFYFLEMNTRLQVEHPITEYITGVDIVEEMINIAAGHPLRYKQKDIGINGWAFESRVYAENPLKNFLPSIGRINLYQEPTTHESDPNIRYDTGIVEGSEISMYYDPLICKLVTHGQNRQEAIDKMIWALDRYQVRGPKNNINFLRSALEHPRMRSGDISTKFISEEYPDGYKGQVYSKEQLKDAVIGVATLDLCRSLHSQSITGTPDLSQSSSHVVVIQGQRYQVEIVPDPEDLPNSFEGMQDNYHIEDYQGHYNVLYRLLENNEAPISLLTPDAETKFSLSKISFTWTSNTTLFIPVIDGKEVPIQFIEVNGKGYLVQHCGSEVSVDVRTHKEDEYANILPPKKVTINTNAVFSPMPGTVRSIAVKPGDKVDEGQELLVLEAMKMQNLIVSPHEGIVKSVRVQQGNEVDVDAILIEFA